MSKLLWMQLQGLKNYQTEKAVIFDRALALLRFTNADGVWLKGVDGGGNVNQ